MVKISVHKQTHNKEHKPAAGWLNIDESLEWLKGWTCAGHAWCATHFVGRHRLAENARGSGLVVVDIDGDCTLEQFWAAETVKQRSADGFFPCVYSGSVSKKKRDVRGEQ